MYLRLILGEMQPPQLLHPHVGVPQLCHVVAQGQDAVGATRKGCGTPEHSLPGRQLEGAPQGPVNPPSANWQDTGFLASEGHAG